MAMIRLNDWLPDEKKVPYLGFLGKNHDGLPPNSQFMIIESYCENPSCDCKALIADIVEVNHKRETVGGLLVTIYYNWSSKKKPILHEESPKTDIALRLLKIYKNLVHEGKYLERIKQHYAYVKQLAVERDLHDLRNIIKDNHQKKIGRNEQCPCGSNKKYKRCCLNKVENDGETTSGPIGDFFSQLI